MRVVARMYESCPEYFERFWVAEGPAKEPGRLLYLAEKSVFFCREPRLGGDSRRSVARTIECARDYHRDIQPCDPRGYGLGLRTTHVGERRFLATSEHVDIRVALPVPDEIDVLYHDA